MTSLVITSPPFSQANSHPALVPLPLPSLLLDPLADWTSPAWCHQFSDIFKMAWLPQPRGPTYNAALKCFHKFCVQYSVTTRFRSRSTSFDALQHSWPTKVSPLRLGNHTSLQFAVCIQISLGLPDPREHSSLPILKRVQAGIYRARLLCGTPPRIRLPITTPVLAQIRRILDTSSNPRKVELWAITCTAFCLGELLLDARNTFNPTVDLAWGAIAVDNQENPQMLRIHLKKSKCDQFGVGSDIIVGRTGSMLCPVAAMLSFIAIRGDSPGLFFIDSDKRAFTKSQFVSEMRSILNMAGLPLCWLQLSNR